MLSGCAALTDHFAVSLLILTSLSIFSRNPSACARRAHWLLHMGAIFQCRGRLSLQTETQLLRRFNKCQPINIEP